MIERWQIPEETARKIAAARLAGGRVVAVGTTSVRTLESAAARPEGFGAGTGAHGPVHLSALRLSRWSMRW